MIVDKIEVDEDEKDNKFFFRQPIKTESKKKIEKVNIKYIISTLN